MKTTLAFIYLSLSMTLAFMTGQFTTEKTILSKAVDFGCVLHDTKTGAPFWVKSNTSLDDLVNSLPDIKPIRKPPQL